MLEAVRSANRTTSYAQDIWLVFVLKHHIKGDENLTPWRQVKLQDRYETSTNPSNTHENKKQTVQRVSFKTTFYPL